MLGVSLLSHFVPVAVAPLATEQLLHIVAARLHECAAPVDAAAAAAAGEMEDDCDGQPHWAQRCAAALVAVYATTEAAARYSSIAYPYAILPEPSVCYAILRYTMLCYAMLCQARAERSQHGPTLRDLLQAAS